MPSLLIKPHTGDGSDGRRGSGSGSGGSGKESHMRFRLLRLQANSLTSFAREVMSFRQHFCDY